MKKVLFGMAVGAALTYLFDPQQGTRRRERLREQLGQAPAGDQAPTIDVVMFDERVPAGVS